MFTRIILSIIAAALGVPVWASEWSSCVWVRAERDAAGSGFVVDAQRRWVVTCRHVIGEQKTADIFFPWVREGQLVTNTDEYLGNRPRLRDAGLLVSGKVLATRDAADLALIQLDSLPPGIRAYPRASRLPRSGDRLTVIGHRSDLDTLWNITTGPLRTTGRLVDGYHWRGQLLARNADVLIGQLPIEEGDSGGPVLNDRGELVGMACALRRQVPLAAVAISLAEIHALLDPPAPPAQPEPQSIAETLMQATVWIRPTATEFLLAGVVIDSHHILTSARGLGPAHRVGIAFPLRSGDRWLHERLPYRDPVGVYLRGAWRAGEVIARDENRDLALLRVDSMPSLARPIALSSSLPRPGDAVHAMNHPGGLEFAWVYSSGSVRQRGQLKLGAGDDARAVSANLFQLPTQAGSPGGPVLNARGELIGVLSTREGAQFTAYAATTDELAAFLESSRVRVPPLLLRAARIELERTQRLARARQAIDEKNWRAARGELDRMLDPFPADAEARQSLMGVLLGLNKDDEAAAALADVLRAEPDRWPILAKDLLSHADELSRKFPDSPSAVADWLRQALTAARSAPLDPATIGHIDMALKQAAAAKSDADKLIILRRVVARFASEMPRRRRNRSRARSRGPRMGAFTSGV